jgi:rubredoxin
VRVSSGDFDPGDLVADAADQQREGRSRLQEHVSARLPTRTSVLRLVLLASPRIDPEELAAPSNNVLHLLAILSGHGGVQQIQQIPVVIPFRDCETDDSAPTNAPTAFAHVPRGLCCPACTTVSANVSGAPLALKLPSGA